MTAVVDANRARAPAAPGRDLTRCSRTLWIIAADCGIVALAIAQSMHGDQRLALVLSLAAVAGVLLAVVARRALHAAAQGGALAHVLGGFAIATVVVALIVAGRATVGAGPVLLVAAAFLGVALVLRWLVAAIEASDAEAAPWQSISGASAAPRAARPRAAALGAGAGALLLIGAAGGVIRIVTEDAAGHPQVRGIATAFVTVAVLIALVAGPFALVSQARGRRIRTERERGRQRQAVAAHLHDSVLQTLALIQRSAGDEQRVLLLARQQERGLRAWLAGRDDPAAASVGAALRTIAEEVEDEHAGRVAIELIVIADAPLDERGSADALVQATREALRNAARHAGGTVRVVLDPDAMTDELVVFVRDTGAGFDRAQVPAERRGIRDAIIGRVRHAGGSAAFDSGPDGTEVELRVPRPAA